MTRATRRALGTSIELWLRCEPSTSGGEAAAASGGDATSLFTWQHDDRVVVSLQVAACAPRDCATHLRRAFARSCSARIVSHSPRGDERGACARPTRSKRTRHAPTRRSPVDVVMATHSFVEARVRCATRAGVWRAARLTRLVVGSGTTSLSVRRLFGDGSGGVVRRRAARAAHTRHRLRTDTATMCGSRRAGSTTRQNDVGRARRSFVDGDAIVSKAPLKAPVATLS